MEVKMDQMGKEILTLNIQNKDLVERVKRLEDKLTEESSTKDLFRLIKKRETNNNTINKKHCASSGNLCTFFYPDHPDQSGKKINSGPSRVITSRNNTETLSSKVPESCQDLQLIGHTLSGFYLVQKEEGISKKIETIFCQFDQQQVSGTEAFKRMIYHNVYFL